MFGPRGFSSVVYGLYVLHNGRPEGNRLFRVTALVVAASIVLLASTDVPAVRILGRTPNGKSTGVREPIATTSLLDPVPVMAAVWRRCSSEK